MTTFDLILIALTVVVLTYQCNLLIRMKRDVIIPGTAPSKKAIGVIMVLVLVLAVVRAQDFARQWPVFALVFLVCLTVFIGGAGLSANGMYSSGSFISFKQAAYYEIAKQPDGRPVFRLSRLTREGHMIITPEQQAEIEELMMLNRIPNFEEYQKKMAKRLTNRVAASQKKKKK